MPTPAPVCVLRRLSAKRLVFAVVPLLLAAGCARTTEQAPRAQEPAPSAAPAAAPPPAEAEPAASRAPSSLEESEERNDEGFARPADRDELGQAVAELERARAELDGALSPRKGRSASSAGASASRGAELDRESKPAAAAPAPKADKKSAESSCSTACHAFTSLGRAASAVCRLAGEKDGRCTHAHAVLADAEKRVAVCGCHPD